MNSILSGKYSVLYILCSGSLLEAILNTEQLSISGDIFGCLISDFTDIYWVFTQIVLNSQQEKNPLIAKNDPVLIGRN